MLGEKPSPPPPSPQLPFHSSDWSCWAGQEEAYAGGRPRYYQEEEGVDECRLRGVGGGSGLRHGSHSDYDHTSWRLIVPATFWRTLVSSGVACPLSAQTAGQPGGLWTIGAIQFPVVFSQNAAIGAEQPDVLCNYRATRQTLRSTLAGSPCVMVGM